ERRLAPGGLGVSARRVVRLAAAVGMVDGIHRDAPGLRADALVALAPGLAELHVLVLEVRERAHRRAAVGADHPHLGGGQAERDHRALLRGHLDPRARGAAEPAALARNELGLV